MLAVVMAMTMPTMILMMEMMVRVVVMEEIEEEEVGGEAVADRHLTLPTSDYV